MPAPKGNQHAVGNKGGNPGYGKMAFLRLKVEQHSELWWTKWEDLIKSKNWPEQQFAMAEFNKLQAKMIPQDINLDVPQTMSDILNKLNGNNIGTTKGQELEAGEPIQDNE
jgi:hypothetical protein